MLDYKGPDKEQEIRQRYIARDTREPLTRILDLVSHPFAVIIVFVTAGVVGFVRPWTLQMWIPVCALLYLGAVNKRANRTLPMKLPRGTGIKDLNDPKPKRRDYNMAAGSFYVGNEQKTNLEIWFTDDDMKTHGLAFGATGGGKTELLVAISANSLAMGSGVIYSDAKASPDLLWQIADIARRMGRDDDVLVINYGTGGQSYTAYSREPRSNTNNPFAFGTADSCTQILQSMLPPASEGDNAVFTERAHALAAALMRPLVELRNLGVLLLGIDTLREYMTLERLMHLANRDDLSMTSLNAMRTYLRSLAGYRDGLDAAEQPNSVHEQLGFAVMYFTKALDTLAGTYGNIYFTSLGEIDFHDVVMNRRILVILIPAMEKAPQELQNLGKINLASIRDAMKVGLGNTVAGDRADVLENSLVASDRPTLLIADEYGSQAAEGTAVAAAQGRGLGFSVWFAGQDYAGFKKASEREAQQIVANTNIKFLLKLEDPEDTWKLFEQLAGEAIISQTQGYRMEGFNVMANYQDKMDAVTHRTKRIDIRDAREQMKGECHIFQGDRIVRANAFFVAPPKSRNWRYNEFLGIASPIRFKQENDGRALRALDEFFQRRLKGEKPAVQEVPEDLAIVLSAMARAETAKRSANECAIAGFMAYHEHLNGGRRQAGDTDSESEGALPAGAIEVVVDASRRNVNPQTVLERIGEMADEPMDEPMDADDDIPEPDSDLIQVVPPRQAAPPASRPVPPQSRAASGLLIEDDLQRVLEGLEQKGAHRGQGDGVGAEPQLLGAELEQPAPQGRAGSDFDYPGDLIEPDALDPAMQAPPAPAPQPVDEEAAQVAALEAAILRIESASGKPEVTARLHAKDVMRNINAMLTYPTPPEPELDLGIEQDILDAMDRISRTARPS